MTSYLLYFRAGDLSGHKVAFMNQTSYYQSLWIIMCLVLCSVITQREVIKHCYSTTLSFGKLASKLFLLIKKKKERNCEITSQS